MRRLALRSLSLVLTFTALVMLAPLSEVAALSPHQSTAAQLDNNGVFNQIDSLLNNFTKRFDLNSLIPQQTTTPSVNITSVKTVNTGQSTTTPVSYTHLRAHETPEHLVCRLLLEKKKNKTN